MPTVRRKYAIYPDLDGRCVGDRLDNNYFRHRSSLRKIDHIENVPMALRESGHLPFPDGPHGGVVVVGITDSFVATPALSGPPVRVAYDPRRIALEDMRSEDDLLLVATETRMFDKVLGSQVRLLPTSFRDESTETYKVGTIDVHTPRASSVRPDLVLQWARHVCSFEAKLACLRRHGPIRAMPLRQLAPQLLVAKANYPDYEALTSALLFDTPTKWRLFVFSMLGGRLQQRLSRNIELFPAA